MLINLFVNKTYEREQEEIVIEVTAMKIEDAKSNIKQRYKCSVQ